MGVLLPVTALCLFGVGFASWRLRSPEVAVLGGGVVIVYLFDAVATRGNSLYVSETYSSLWGSDQAFAVVVTDAVACLAFFVMAFAIVQRRVPFGVVRIEGRPSIVMLSLLSVPIVVSLLSVFRGGTESILLNRQQYYEASPVALVATSLASGVVILGALLAREPTQGFPRRTLGLFIACVALLFSMLSGSRSTFLLSTVLPLIVWWAWPRLSGLGWRRKFLWYSVGGATLMLATVAYSVVFVANTRNVEITDNVFATADLSQFDVTVALVDRGVRASTYHSFIGIPIPREVWPGKPYSGNAVACQQLFPVRLYLTSSEVAASLLGEARMNAGGVGWLVAGVVLTLLGVGVRLLRTGRPHEQLIYLSILLRSVNVVRGDLQGIILPIGATVFAVFMVYSVPRFVGRRQRVTLRQT